MAVVSAERTVDFKVSFSPAVHDVGGSALIASACCLMAGLDIDAAALAATSIEFFIKSVQDAPRFILVADALVVAVALRAFKDAWLSTIDLSFPIRFAGELPSPPRFVQ